MNNTVTRHSLAKQVNKKTKVPVDVIHHVIDCAIDTIMESIGKGEEVTFRKFGRFHTKKRAGRKCNLAKDYMENNIPAHIIPVFTPSDQFKRFIKDKIQAK